MPASSDSVKVAVRVRPFNQRELNASSRCVISMNGTSTTITNPENQDTKNFSFDHSYWSHDGFKVNEDGISVPESSDSTYADQRQVFSDLGQGVLDNAWQGYNAALFAYGQTGSGKSYSMIGYGPNKGIVPITCEELFKVIEENEDKSKQLQVSFSMLEIYNEQVRDLLVKGKPPHGGLKIRQNPKSGFYVEGLKQVPVQDYKAIEKLMEQGTVNRTTASTNMNATSSRSHMVITIRFEQVYMSATGQSNTRSSDINLVDLAGSERADSTGATGDRLKEGSAINQSLSTLGNVISALADIAMGKKKVLVPYRDSVLTKLLQSALGGNSRTIMIAALSPADINYDETLSTLRYADRAKKIQNKAVVNESPTDRLIRELKEENARLMALLKKQGAGGAPGDTAEIERLLLENQRRMQDMNMTWEQRLTQARMEWEKSQGGRGLDLEDKEWQRLPYLTNINEDPQLSGVIKHCLNQDKMDEKYSAIRPKTGKTQSQGQTNIIQGKNLIGRSGTGGVSIELRGLGISGKHAELFSDGSSVLITPCVEQAVVIVNGIKVREKHKLQNLDRIKLGSSSLFLYVGFPKERTDPSEIPKYNFDYFMTELAEHEGVALEVPPTPGKGQEEDLILFQEILDLMPKIAEANAISEELNRKVKFEHLVKNHAMHDPLGEAKEKEILIKVTNTDTRKVWVWSKDKFLNRKDLIDEIYLKHMDGENPILTRDRDPFWDPVEDVFLGSCRVMLSFMAHQMDIDEHYPIHNYRGKEEGVIQVQLLPCDSAGKILPEDGMIMEPKDLLGKTLNYQLCLCQCMNIRWVTEEHSRGVYFRFSMYDQKGIKTETIWHKSLVDVNFKKQFTFKSVKKNFLDYLQKNSLVLELWGSQVSENKELHKRKSWTEHGVKQNGGGQLQLPTDKALKLKEHEDIVSLLKQREREVEQLEATCEDLRKDNFKLKQQVFKQKQHIDMNKLRRGSLSERPPVSNSGGVDAELAKNLREFFRDVKGVQEQLKEMKQNVSKALDGVNGNVKKTLDAQVKNLQTADDKLNGCVACLKQGVSAALQRSKDRATKSAIH